MTVTPTGASALAGVTTGSTGAYAIAIVPVGGGTVAVTNVPAACAVPAPASYTGLAAGASVTVNLVVSCTAPAAPTGTVAGTVSSGANGTGIAGVQVTVTPSGVAALPAITTSSTGAYSVSNVPVGSGTVSVAGLPTQCTTPSPAPYTVTANQATQVPITVSCGSASITISFGTLPPEVAPAVRVTYPDASVHTLSGNTTITGLTAGTYAVSLVSPTVYSTDAIVSTRWNATALSPASFTLSPTGSQTVTSTLTQVGGTGGLWVATEEGDIAREFTNVGGALRQTFSFTNGNWMPTPVGLAVDASGNLWVSSTGSYFRAPCVDEFTTSTLASGGAASPTIEICLPTGTNCPHSVCVKTTYPGAIAFDARGGLWVADSANGVLYGYSSLHNGATPTVSQYLTPDRLGALAFDQQGNLWAASGHGELIAFAAASLQSSNGFGKPYLLVLADAGVPVGIAFDASGNLWVTQAPDQVLEYSAAQIALPLQTSNPTPVGAYIVNGSSPSLAGLVFDNSGDLWMIDTGDGAIDVFTNPGALGGSGTITPNSQGAFAAGSRPLQFAFDPGPRNTGLAGSRVARSPRSATMAHPHSSPRSH